MYNAEALVERTLDSLLSQDFDSFAVVAIDDCSTDRTIDVAQRYLNDPRLTVERNDRRVGMIENWNRTWTRARELHGDFEYFAWASDNDWRDTNWLSVLVKALDEHPEAAMAFSVLHLWEQDGAESEVVRKWEFELRSVSDRAERFTAMRHGAPIGAMMYGLQRRAIVERLGAVPETLFSDHLFLSQVALFGPILQETGTRWYRGSQRTGGSRKGQRNALFAQRPPLITFTPVWAQHVFKLLESLVVRGRGPDEMSRVEGLRLTGLYLAGWMQRFVWKIGWEISKWKVKRRKAWGGGFRVPLRAALGVEIERQVREIERVGDVEAYPHEVRTELIHFGRRLKASAPVGRE